MKYHIENKLENDINMILQDLSKIDSPNHADRCYVDSCIEIIQDVLIHIYSSDSKFNAKKLLFNEILEQYVYRFFKNKLYDCPYIFELTTEMKEKYKNQFKYLSTIKQPVQRSNEWYEYRNSRITASDSASILNKNPYKSRDQLLIEKSTPRNNRVSISGDAIRHGVIFEDVVCHIYEYIENTKVKEFGCLPHDSIPFLGASPDGIDQNGIMLEIKCPTGRKIYGTPPYVYWHQIQQQLEVANLNLCHYVECYIRVIEEEDFLINYREIGTKYTRGVIIEYFNYTINKLEYVYYPYRNALKYYKKWEESEINKLIDDEGKDYRNTIYWILDTYSKCDIFRNKRWFNEVLTEYEDFWKKVEECKTDPEMLPKKKICTRKKKIKCLISESDEDTDIEDNSVLDYIKIN